MPVRLSLTLVVMCLAALPVWAEKSVLVHGEQVVPGLRGTAHVLLIG
jgi:hypothetical protein